MQIKLMSWNVNGWRARIKAGFEHTLRQIQPDIACLQETKVLMPELKAEYPAGVTEYLVYLNPASKRGYSGTGLLTKEKPKRMSMGFPSLKDTEGRIILAEYERFALVNVYTPNSKDNLSRLAERKEWDKEFARVCAAISKQKPVIITGDLNVAHKQIDVHNPAAKTMMAGFTAQEREAMDNLLEQGFIDTFRLINGDIPSQYSYYSYYGNCRLNNVGWRLDYFLVSNSLKPHVKDATIERNTGSSDHVPVTLTLEFND